MNAAFGDLFPWVVAAVALVVAGWALSRASQGGRDRPAAGASEPRPSDSTLDSAAVAAALHDPLTGLPGRTLFMDRLAVCIARSRRRPGYRFATLLLNLDRFKNVNNSLGHRAGDALLVLVAGRLAGCLRPGDSVARLGGDEFAVLIDEMSDQEVPSIVAARIELALRDPFVLEGREVFVTASVGTALNKDRYEGPEDFLRDADTALHHAKEQGKARHEVFHTAMHARALARLQLENDLHRALEREELSLHYQPIVGLRDGAIVGFEALLRWLREGQGLVPPADFIRLAEETGLILPMGNWVLREACQQVSAWQERWSGSARTALSVSVNLSPRQFAQPDLVEQVDRVLVETALAAGSLKLEVTETTLMQEPEAAAAMLAALSERRVGVCIDDFGTGFSSLSYLVRLPVHTMKVDQSFVRGLSGRREQALVATIVALARNLEMDVVAEGVETREQLVKLREIGCDYVQGFLLSKPLDAAGAGRLLEAGTAPFADI
jgi:diguanylate cyclase (GGDEF)-like protein